MNNIYGFVTIQDNPVQIVAIAASWDIMDISVIMAKSDFSGYIVAEAPIRGERYDNVTFHPNRDKAVQDFTNRAFGPNL
jgi:hypothetical protein